MAVRMQFKTEIAARFKAWCRSNSRPYPTEVDGQHFFDNAGDKFPAVKSWIGDDAKAFVAFLLDGKLVKRVVVR
jgi:hypothetical protein